MAGQLLYGFLIGLPLLLDGQELGNVFLVVEPERQRSKQCYQQQHDGGGQLAVSGKYPVDAEEEADHRSLAYYL